jgi:hypothetical protein
MMYFTMPICHTHVYSTYNEILDYFIYLLLTIKEFIYKYILLISDGPVSWYPGGDTADGYKTKCSLLLANVFFTPVYSTGPSPTVSADVQY